jgi:hypothetical protein
VALKPPAHGISSRAMAIEPVDTQIPDAKNSAVK